MLKELLGATFIESTGKTNDVEFWSQYSGITSDCAVDHMVAVLAGLGYTGTPMDMLRAWLQVTAGNLGTTYDNAKSVFTGVFAGFSTGTPLLDDDGNPLYDDGGNVIYQ
jgi:hypothetical protein